MKIASKNVRRAVLVIMGGGGALFLALHLLYLTANQGEVGILRYSTGITVAFYLFAIAAATIGTRRGHSGYYVLCLLGFALFLLSMRSVVLNAAAAEINEYFAGIRVGSVELSDFNDRPYCVKMSGGLVEIVSAGRSASFVFFRGAWPGYISDQAVDDAFLPLKRCNATGAP